MPHLGEGPQLSAGSIAAIHARINRETRDFSLPLHKVSLPERIQVFSMFMQADVAKQYLKISATAYPTYSETPRYHPFTTSALLGFLLGHLLAIRIVGDQRERRNVAAVLWQDAKALLRCVEEGGYDLRDMVSSKGARLGDVALHNLPEGTLAPVPRHRPDAEIRNRLTQDACGWVLASAETWLVSKSMERQMHPDKHERNKMYAEIEELAAENTTLVYDGSQRTVYLRPFQPEDPLWYVEE